MALKAYHPGKASCYADMTVLTFSKRDRRWAFSAAGRSKLLIIRETECLTVLLARLPVPAAAMTASGAMLVGMHHIPVEISL